MDEVYKCKKECYKHFITTAAWTWSIVLAAVMSFCKETTDSAISVPFQSDNLHSKPLAGECQDAWIDFIIPLLQIVTSSTLSLRAANHCKLIIWFNAIPTSEMCLFELNVWYLAVNLWQVEKFLVNYLEGFWEICIENYLESYLVQSLIIVLEHP